MESFWPYQLQPHRQGDIAPNQDWSRNGFCFVTGDVGAEATFMAPLKLRGGSRITEFSVCARCLSPGNMNASIKRKKMDGEVEVIADVSATNNAYPTTWFDDTSITSPVVEPGYLHWVEVYAQDARAYICGVKVFYR